MFSENDINNDINTLDNLKFNFSLNDRFVHVKDENNKYFEFQTPFLKILKPIHSTLNKKKTIAKKYLILETNDELDFNNEIGEFIFVINKIHELSQEKIREKSVEWFNTEFDDIGLDIKVRRPIDQQKDNEFIKISIPKNSEIENEIANLSKDNYVRCNIIFKGLKVSSEYIIEDWEIKDFITQEKYDEIQNIEFVCNTINNDEQIQTLLEENINILEEVNTIEENNKIISEELAEITENKINIIHQEENNIIKIDEVLLEKDNIQNIIKKTKDIKKSNKNDTKEKIKLNKGIKIDKTNDLIKKFSKKIIFS
jgi:hypothetical protein